MINGYKQLDVQDTTENATIYKASKDNKLFYMYQYEVFNECDEFSFKIIGKLPTCTHILKTIQKFQHDGLTYYITEYAESNLLKEQFKQNNHIFPMKSALQYFCKVIELLQQLHSRGLIYRDICPQKIKVKSGQLFLNDFNLSQFQKRKQRLFQIVGLQMYLAPQFFTEDGYGQQVDIWAAGVLLYYMLTQEYPFCFNGKTQKEFLSQFNNKCKGGFKFGQLASQSKKASHLKNNKILDQFFSQIFQMDYQKRISISEIKKNKLFQGLFQNKIDNQMLQEIGQRDQSLFISQLGKYPSSYDFHKDQVILSFMEHASQSFMLDCADVIPEKLRQQTSFSILKVALMRTYDLQQIVYGQKKPQFQISEEEWQQMRNTTAFQLIKQKIQRKHKIILTYYKGALMNFQQEKDQFYSQKIPELFQDVKVKYRTNLMKMFEFGKNLMKKKAERKSTRKICQNLVKLTILCLINRIFDDSDLNQNFQLYFKWSNTKSLEQIQNWISNQKVSNLKTFMKAMTSKYLE